MPTSAALLGADDSGDCVVAVGNDSTTSSHHLAHPHAHHPHHQFKFSTAENQQQTSSSSSSSTTAGTGSGISSSTLTDLALLSAVAASSAAQNSCIEASSIPSCAACDLKISDLYYLVAVGKAWHPHCLRCTACQESLTEGSCFWKAGNIYCREDYQRLFCRCAGCGDDIDSQDLIMSVVDSSDLDGRVSCMLFHFKCFQCALCHRHLERGAKFFTQGANIYCEQHFDICTSASPLLLPMAPLSTNGTDLLCPGNSYVFGADMDCDIKPAGGKKSGKNSTAKGRKNSAKNNQQNNNQTAPISPLQQAVPLSSSSPHNNNNNALLKSSPVEAVTSCAGDMLANVPTSSQPLFKSRTPPPSHSQQQHPPPLIHRHTHQGLLSTVPAYSLATPATLRQPGEPGGGGIQIGCYFTRDGGDSSNNVDYCSAAAAVVGANEFGDVLPPCSNGNINNGNQVIPTSQPSSASQQSAGSMQNSSNSGGSQQRGKRIRTSFKHTQLKIMKHYFSENHNPDAKDLKQLAIKTGLSKRVLQVWFQNARAKYRRTLLKEQQKQGGSAGVSMLAGNPVGFLGGNSSMSDRAQSTSLLDGDSPLSNNSGGGHEGMTGISSASMTIGGEDDDIDMDDDLDDGFQDADELESTSDRRSRNGMTTSKSPASGSGSGRHLSPSHAILGIPCLNNIPGIIDHQQQQPQQIMTSSTANNSTTSAAANYLFIESAASTLYSTPGTVDFNLGQIIQPSML